MLSALPDLSLPLAGAAGAAFGGFERDGLVVAVPDRLTLEADSDGRPRLLLTLIRSSGQIASTGGRLEFGLSIESDLTGIGQALVARGTPASLVVAELEGGVLTMHAALGPLTRTELSPPQTLPPDLLTRARFSIELAADAAVVVSRLIEEATLPLEATLRLRFRAVAPRIPLCVTYDPLVVAQQLATRLGAEAVIAMEDLESAIDALLGGPEIVVEGNPNAVDPRLRAQTAALRLRDRFATRADGDPGKFKLIPVQSVPSGRDRIDFAEAAAVVVEQVLCIDPVSVARSMQSGSTSELVKHIEVPPLPTGRQRIVLSANLPEPVAGMVMLLADFRAPELPPFRMQPLSASVSLGLPERRGEAELRLAFDEQLAGEVRLRAIVTKNGEPVELVGPWRSIQGADALLLSTDFGAPLVVLRLSSALTALAAVEVVVDGTVLARLDRATPVMAIPLTEPGLRIFARPLAGGREIEIDLGGRKRLDLDPATLPGFGAHHARFTMKEPKPLMVEWRAEGDEAQVPLSVRMGADRSVAEIGWVAASPFRPGMLWRVVREGTPGPWSAPVLPQDSLLIEVDGRTP